MAWYGVRFRLQSFPFAYKSSDVGIFGPLRIFLLLNLWVPVSTGCKIKLCDAHLVQFPFFRHLVLIHAESLLISICILLASGYVFSLIKFAFRLRWNDLLIGIEIQSTNTTKCRFNAHLFIFASSASQYQSPHVKTDASWQMLPFEWLRPNILSNFIRSCTQWEQKARTFHTLFSLISTEKQCSCLPCSSFDRSIRFTNEKKTD